MKRDNIYLLGYGHYSDQYVAYITYSEEAAKAWELADGEHWIQETQEYNEILPPLPPKEVFYQVSYIHYLDTNITEIIGEHKQVSVKEKDEIIIRPETRTTKPHFIATSTGKSKEQTDKICYDRIAHQRAIYLGVV